MQTSQLYTPVAEAGGPKDYEVSRWNVIATPKGLSSAFTEKIRRDVAEAVASSDVQDRYATLGHVPLSLDRAKIEL